LAGKPKNFADRLQSEARNFETVQSIDKLQIFHLQLMRYKTIPNMGTLTHGVLINLGEVEGVDRSCDFSVHSASFFGVFNHLQPRRRHRFWRKIRQKTYLYSSLPPPTEGGYVFGAVCLSACPSDYSQTCERILTKFCGGVGHGSRTKWYNFGGDPDHASDPGVQSPKSGSSGSAEVCSLWVHSCIMIGQHSIECT